MEHAREVLHEYLAAEGVEVDTGAWLDAFRWPDRDQAVRELAASIGRGNRFVLVDRGHWGDSFELRPQAMRFTPAAAGNDAAPDRQLDAWRSEGASFVAVAWPAFDWLHSGAAVPSHLQTALRPVLANPRVVVFELRA